MKPGRWAGGQVGRGGGGDIEVRIRSDTSSYSDTISSSVLARSRELSWRGVAWFR